MSTPKLLLVSSQSSEYDAHRFAYEVEAEQELERLLKPHFILRRQIHMRHWSGSLGRMDYLAVPRGDFPVSWFGIEAKRDFTGFNQFTSGIVQAYRYRESTVEEKERLTVIKGEHPPFVLLWPTPVGYGSFDNTMLGGAMRVAGKVNVGAIVTRRGRLQFIGCGGHLWWDEVTGPTRLLEQITADDERGWKVR